MSMSWTTSPETDIICPVRLSIRGTSVRASTGLMRFFFWPVNALIATILAFAEPCFPGFDFSNSTILHGSPSIITYWPILRLPTSTGLLTDYTLFPLGDVFHLKDFPRAQKVLLGNSFQ